MRLLEKIFVDYGNGIRLYYQEKDTGEVRGNNGLVLPEDAIFEKIGVNVSKYKHHVEIAQMIIIECKCIKQGE